MSAWLARPEVAWIGAGAMLYATAAGFAVLAIAAGHRAGRTAGIAGDRGVPWLVAAALVCLAAGIGYRWQRLGHGPFISMFEVLASSLTSLGAVYAIAWWRLPSIRRTSSIVLPLLTVMAIWLMCTSSADTHLPPTYATPVLWFHVLLGKAFLGCALVALGIAGVVLLRARAATATWFERMPGDAALDRLAWRFMQAALVFESAMLIAGAVWAQDAWGRYWAWDPLETWAFVTWLALAGSLHARIAFGVAPRVGAALVVGVFALAFVTFFGVPFVTGAPHKGAL